MAILLTEADVKGLLTMPLAIAAAGGSERHRAFATASAHTGEKLPSLHGGGGCHGRLHGAEDLFERARRIAVHRAAVSCDDGRLGGADRSGLSGASANGGGQRSGDEANVARGFTGGGNYRYGIAGANATGG